LLFELLIRVVTFDGTRCSFAAAFVDCRRASTTDLKIWSA